MLESSEISVFDARGGDRVERRGRLVEQQHFRIGREGAGDAEPLLLTAGEPVADVAQPVLHLVPQRGLLQRLLDPLIDQRFLRMPRTRRPEATFS